LGPGVDETRIARGDDKTVGVVFRVQDREVRMGVQYSVSALGESLDIARLGEPIELTGDIEEFAEDLDLTLEIVSANEIGEVALEGGLTASVAAGFSKYRALSEELEGIE